MWTAKHHVLLCVCVCVCVSVSLHCVNEIVTSLNLTFFILQLWCMANCNVLSVNARPEGNVTKTNFCAHWRVNILVSFQHLQPVHRREEAGAACAATPAGQRHPGHWWQGVHSHHAWLHRHLEVHWRPCQEWGWKTLGEMWLWAWTFGRVCEEAF